MALLTRLPSVKQKLRCVVHSNSVLAEVGQKQSLCQNKSPGSITNLFHELGRFLLISCSCCIYVLLQQI